jgi:hypothetical protein
MKSVNICVAMVVNSSILNCLLIVYNLWLATNVSITGFFASQGHRVVPTHFRLHRTFHTILKQRKTHPPAIMKSLTVLKVLKTMTAPLMLAMVTTHQVMACPQIIFPQTCEAMKMSAIVECAAEH